MFDPNDLLSLDVEGVGQFKARCLSERQLKAFNRSLEEKVNGDLEAHHAKMNATLAPVLVDADLESMSLAQKIQLANALPWALTNAELDRIKKAVPSPSESPTESSAKSANPENAATT